MHKGWWIETFIYGMVALVCIEAVTFIPNYGFYLFALALGTAACFVTGLLIRGIVAAWEVASAYFTYRYWRRR